MPLTVCPFVNSAETIQSDDFNRADKPTGCGSTLKGTPYINNIISEIGNNTYMAKRSAGDPCEIPAVTVTSGNLSYQFNLTAVLHDVIGNNREISFIDYVGVMDQFALGSVSNAFCWTFGGAQVCTTNSVARDVTYTFRFNFDADNQRFTGYWYNGNTLIETFGNQLDNWGIGGFGGRKWLNGEYYIDDFMMWNSTALGGGACPRG